MAASAPSALRYISVADEYWRHGRGWITRPPHKRGEMYGFVIGYTHPCTPWTEYVRLCVGCNWQLGHCPAQFLRLSVTCPVPLVSVQLCVVERPSEAERSRASNSNALAKPSGLKFERLFLRYMRSEAGSSSYF